LCAFDAVTATGVTAARGQQVEEQTVAPDAVRVQPVLAHHADALKPTFS
jgi:hypothetical protein